MFIRLFAYSKNQDEAKAVFARVINSIESSITNKEYVKIEPYWKIQGIYVVEANLELQQNFEEEIRKKFLESISDKWTFFGNPIDEALASETTEGCNYIKKGVNMINIFY